MTKPHTLAYYMDGQQRVEFCKVCSAEGFALYEDCPGKTENSISHEQKSLDEKKQTVR